MSLPFRVYPIRRDEVLRRSALRNPSPDETKLAEEVMRDGAYLLEYHITERPRPMDLVTEPVLKEALTGSVVLEKTAQIWIDVQSLGEPALISEEDCAYYRDFFMNRYGQKRKEGPLCGSGTPQESK